MANELKAEKPVEKGLVDQAEQPADDEYRKPNPQDNPRNIALAEVAKTVQAKHAVDASETADSIDDDGNITPAGTAAEPQEPADTESVADATPAAAPAKAEEKAPEAAPGAIFPDQEYDAVVEGKKIKVKGQSLIDAGFRTFQKETAADYRLQMASELLKEAENKTRALTTPAPQPAPRQETTAQSDADLAQAVQFGTPEQAEKAIKELRGRGNVPPEHLDQMIDKRSRMAVQDEIQFQSAKEFVDTEYKDLLSNDYLRRMFFLEENRRRAPKERGGEGSTKSYKDLYAEIGEDLRKNFNLPKPSTGATPSSPTPPGTAAVRQARKADTPPVPRTAATRISEASEVTKAPTSSELIARMAASRGKNQLTANRKG